MRQTSLKEIDIMAQHIYESPSIVGYPVSFLDLPPGLVLHLRKVAYVFLTGDFDFIGELAPS